VIGEFFSAIPQEDTELYGLAQFDFDPDFDLEVH